MFSQDRDHFFSRNFRQPTITVTVIRVNENIFENFFFFGEHGKEGKIIFPSKI